MKSSSIRFEISVLYTAILGLILIVFGSVMYFISNAFLVQTDQQLQVKAQAFDWAIRSYLSEVGDTPSAMPEAVRKSLLMKRENAFQYRTWRVSQKWCKQSQSLGLNKDYINVVGEDTKEVFSSYNLEGNLRVLFLEDNQFPPAGRVYFRSLKAGFKNIRVINYPFVDKGVGQYLIQIGMAQEPLMNQLRNWLYSIAISVPLVLILTSFVGRVLTNRLLQPVQEITDMANRITQEDLSARIKTKHSDVEMEALIDSFNGMIARLEQSFKHIEQFSYHVAHELKTPLTIIQGEAELLLRKERFEHEYRQALRIVMEESQRVLKTVDDLLLLTKLGYQHEAFKFEQFDFVEFFNEIIEQNRFLVAEKGIGIRLQMQDRSSALTITGDRLHLRRLFFNIISNAIKFTSEGGTINMRIEDKSDHIITYISDQGPGISPENLKQIFAGFYGKSTRGSLGLHIAHSIAQLHQGRIEVESQEHGTTFKIILPKNFIPQN